MANRKHRAMDTATEDRWRLLGRLFRARRMELGYAFRPAFAEAKLPRTPQGNLSVRLLNAIENGERPGSYAPGRLEQFARAYEVTPESVYAVLEGKADGLVPAPAVPDAPPAQMPPMTDAARVAGARPYLDRISRQLRRLAAQGVTDPSGAQVFGPGPDAQTWDGIGARLDIEDRAWLIADLQRRDDGRSPGAGTGTAGA